MPRGLGPLQSPLKTETPLFYRPFQFNKDTPLIGEQRTVQFFSNLVDFDAVD